MAVSFPGSVPSYPDTQGSEVLGSAGGGIGLSRILDDYGLDITALATKIGTGSATPAAGKVLRASGTGTSTWGAVDLTADVTGTLPVANGGTGAATHTSGNYLKGAGASAVTSQTPAAAAAQLGALLFPVGAIYIATVSTNPNTLLGFGTWSAFGAGKVLVGLDSGDTDFDAAEETGGAKTHTLTTDEIPGHTHTVQYGLAGVGTGANLSARFDVTGNNELTTSTGGGSAHNNLQPYIVVYMWKRTA